MFKWWPVCEELNFFSVFLQYGEIEEMNVCDNLGDHLVGNVYVKFRYEEDAEKAVTDLDNRWYNGMSLSFALLWISLFNKQNTATLLQNATLTICHVETTF